MPLYEYRCSSCGEEFEKMVRFSQVGKPQECPKCQSNDTKRQLSRIASLSSSTSSSSGTCASSGPFR